MKSDNEIIKVAISTINESMNPFSDAAKGNLYNIATGKAVRVETETFLLNLETIGDTKRREFINDCIKRPERFEERISKQKVSTFATEMGRTKVRSNDGKIKAACLMRDLFGSLLHISLEKKVDLEEVLKYPLTPLPLSLCHMDGTMLQSPKSALLKYLEVQTQSQPPTEVDVTIIDAMFFSISMQTSPVHLMAWLVIF
jgi:hypothetical protein